MPTRRPLEWFEQTMERRDLAAHEKAEYIAVLNEEMKKARSAAEQGERDREDAELLAWVEAQEGDVEADLLPAGLPVASEAWHEVAIRWKQDGALPALPLRDVLRAARQPRQEGDR